MTPGRRPPRGNLPAENTTFVGRRRDLTAVTTLLDTVRLVTLTGVGGVGKTRLARRVGARLGGCAPEGVWLVDVAAVDVSASGRHSPEVQLIAQAVVHTLALHDRYLRQPLEVLTDYLGARRVVLLLDNCEPLLQGCALLVQSLLGTCPGLRVLATSRCRLGVYGEAQYVVRPLPVPDPRRPAPARQLLGCESVALFVDRARRALPEFRLTAGNRHAVAGICRRLEGLPLALELAAARLRTVDAHALHALVADQFAALGPAAPAAPVRQQTLRACIDWSYRLCSAPEQRLWARLAVFSGGFELDAVEGICADELVPKDEVLGLLAELVDKSILTAEHFGVHVRYQMLEAIREFALRRLLAFREGPAVRLRHRDWYRQLVEGVDADTEVVGPRQPDRLARLHREHRNLSTAVEYCLTVPGQTETALHIAVTLPAMYWWGLGTFGEGRRWLDRTLAGTDPPPLLHVRALLLSGYLAACQGDGDTAAVRLGRAQRLSEHLADATTNAFASFLHGILAIQNNDPRAASARYAQALATLAQTPRPKVELLLRCLLALGITAVVLGDGRRARTCFQEILDVTERRGGSYYRSYALWALGLDAWRDGRSVEAVGHMATSLRIKHDVLPTDRYGITLCLEALAWIAADAGQHRRAATLLGAAGTHWDEIGAGIAAHGHLLPYHVGCEQHVRAALTAATYRRAVRAGTRLSTAQAVAYALDQPAAGGAVGAER